MSDRFDPYYTWLGIPPEEQPADYYRLLGIRRYESNAEVIVNAADQRMAYLRTFQAGKRAALSQKLLNEISAAQVCLVDPAKKRAYDERLSRESAAKEAPSQPPTPQVSLPRAQPIQPVVATPLAQSALRNTAQPGSNAAAAATPVRPLAAQPLPPLDPLPVTLASTTRPLQPVIKPKPALLASPIVLVGAFSTAAALVLLIIGGVIWTSWPLPKQDVVKTKPPRETQVQATAVVSVPKTPVVAPTVPADPGPSKPSAEVVRPPITAVESPAPTPVAAEIRAKPQGSPPPLATAPFRADLARQHQTSWASHLAIPIEANNSLGMTLRLIPPGKFRMGWTSQTVPAPKGQRPVQELELPQAFYMANCEVTVGQFRKFVVATGYRTTAETSGKGVGCWDAGKRKDIYEPQWTWQNLPYPIADDHPVAGVSWDDAQAFCHWLSDKEQRSYTLPTEVQWEFACRAGSEGAWCFGDDPDLIEQYAWNYPIMRSQPVGTKLPNAFKLYDVHGSVAEWCLDTMPGRLDHRSFRGCSINAETKKTPAGNQGNHLRTEAMNGIGFRVVLAIPNQSLEAGTIAASIPTPALVPSALLTDQAKAAATRGTVPTLDKSGGSSPVPDLDPASVRHVIGFQADPGPLWARFTPDGKILSFGSEENGRGISIDTATGDKIVLQIGNPVFALSADRSMLASVIRSANQPDQVIVSRNSDSRRNRWIPGSGGYVVRSRVLALAFSEDRRIVFAACGDEKLLALNVFKDFEPIPAFRTNLARVDWLDVDDDSLVCASWDGRVEVHSVRTRKLVHSLDVPIAVNTPIALFNGLKGPESILLFGSDAAILQQYAVSQPPRRIPLPGMAQAADVLTVSADGQMVVLRDRAGIVIWNIAQKKVATRIDLSRSMRLCAIHGQPPLLALEGPGDKLVLCDLAKLLEQPRWQMPIAPDWNGSSAKVRGTVSLMTGNAPPRPADQPPPNRFPGPMPPPANDRALQSAIAALRAKGVQGLESSGTNYVKVNDSELTAEEADGLRLLPNLQTLDLSQCPSASVVLARLRGSRTLTSLQLNSTSVTDDDMSAVATFTQLHELHLSQTKVTGAGLAKLKALVQLQQIALPDGTPADLLAGIAELTSLESISYFPAGVTDAELSHLGRLVRLRSLSLYQAALQGEGLAQLKNLQQLRQLSLPESLPVTAWQHLEGVEFESLHCPASLGDDQLQYLAGNRRLKELSLSPQITDAGLVALSRFPAIENLSLFLCHQLTAEGLAVLPKFPVLKDLRLPQNFEPNSMRHVAAIAGLEKLSLAGCQQHLPLVALANHPRLNHLELGGTTNDDDCAVLAKIRGIRELQFHGSQLTSTGIAQLRALPQLERLFLFQIPLSEKEVKAISSLVQIKHLTLIKHGLARDQVESIRSSLGIQSFGFSKD